MEFRLARQEELGKIYQMYRSAVGGKFCVWDEDYPGMEEVSQDFASGNLFVLTQGQQLLGALSIVPENELDDLACWQVRENACEIARVVISPACQGHGLALYMVQQIITILKKRGCQAIHLSAATANLPALKTYKKAGFTTVGEAWLFGHSYRLLERTISGNDA